MSSFNLKQLEVFAAVVECGSFTEAAGKLYLAQSTVSSHIQALEEALGSPLLRRGTKKRLELTENGRRVYQYARDILAKCRELEDGVLGEGSREVVIGASTLPSQCIIPDLVSSFLSEYPNYTCELKTGDSDRVHQMLLDGDIQVGFTGAANNRQAFLYDKVAVDQIVLVTPNTPKYAELQARGTLGWELLGEPMVFRETGSGTQRTIDNYLSSRNISPKKINVVAKVSSPDVLKEMVANGIGASILSDMMVREYVQQGRLLQFDLEERPIVRNIYMVHQKKGPMSEAARVFMAFAKEKINGKI